MAQSKQIKCSDVQEMLRLIGECRELGDDPIIWRQHFMAGVARLVDADVSAGAEMEGCLNGPQRTPGVAVWGFQHGFNVEGLQIIWEWSVTAPDMSILWNKVQDQLRTSPSPGITLPRQQLLSDREWDRSPDRQIAMRTMGADAVIHSFRQLPGYDAFDGICWFRAEGRPTFNEREVSFIAMMHQEVTRLIGGPLARFNEPHPFQLPRRVRQVHGCVLEGDSDKQIAARLALSQHTVNQYNKQIFRHFSVTSRTELLGRWIRRGWSSKAAWNLPSEEPGILIP